MKTYTYLFFIVLLGLIMGSTLSAQNLVPNGSFEDIPGCPPSPNNGVKFAAPWYTTYLTPDLFGKDCNIPSTPFWDNREAYDGDVFAGIVGQLDNNGTFKSEGLGIPLRSPLQAGYFYYAQVQVRNKGAAFLNPSITEPCVSEPRRQLGVYVSADSAAIGVDIDSVWFTDSYANGERVLVDSSDVLNTNSQGEWQEVSGCFQAEGGERYLGIAGSLGTFQVEAPCELSLDPGFFYNYYLDIDDVQLLAVPFEVNVDTLICNGRLLVDLSQMAPFPIFKDAKFVWEDGNTDTKRVLRKAGTYSVDMVLPCVTVPLYIHAEPSNCGVAIFAPTAFSPNDDGHNDYFRPIISSDWDLQNYTFRIFDRWGKVLFTSSSPSEDWSGRVQGSQSMAPPGVYVWSMEYQFTDGIETKREVKSGTLTLIQ